VRAGRLLGQALQLGDDRAVGEDRLQAHHLRTHGAEAHHTRPAGVGVDGSTDRCRRTRTPVDREVEAGGTRMLLQVLDRHTGAGGDLHRERVDRAQRRAALHREQHRTTTRHAATDQAGVAALGHHCDAGGRAHAQHRSHFLRRARAHHCRGGAVRLPEPVGLVGRPHIGVDEHVGRTHDIAQRADEQTAHRCVRTRSRRRPAVRAAGHR